MPRLFAFLRAINVGGHTVKMDQLRKVLGEMGLANVETFIASGNAIFESSARSLPGLERKIETHLARAFGYDVGTFLRTREEIASIAAQDPFPDAATEKFYVLLLRDEPPPAARKTVLAAQTPENRFALRERELYWWHGGAWDENPPPWKVLERAVGTSTMRNINTLRRLDKKYPPR